MKKILTSLVVICTLCQCSPCRHCPRVLPTEHKDSIRVEYHERLVHDTVKFELPVIIEKHITDDTLSIIENDYAKTVAVVHDGLLSHDLQTKPKVIHVPVAVPVHDTLIYKGEDKVVYQEVEKHLTAWQKFRLKGFWWLAGILLAAILAKFYLRR